MFFSLFTGFYLVGLKDKGKQRAETESRRERDKGKEGQVESKKRADAVPWSNTNITRHPSELETVVCTMPSITPLSTHLADSKQRANYFAFMVISALLDVVSDHVGTLNISHFTI